MAQATATADISRMLNSELEEFQCPDDVKEARPSIFTFSMTVDIHDPEAFYKSAIAHYVKENLPTDTTITPQIMRELIQQAQVVVGSQLDGAVVQICDPGTLGNGAYIQDSTADYVSTLDIQADEPAPCDEGPCP